MASTLNSVGGIGSGDVWIDSILFGSTAHFRMPLNLEHAPYEVLLQSAVRFTPRNPHQVEGYLLANAAGTIERSVCPIWVGHKPDIMRGLVLECVVRSMGLPESSMVMDKALLGDWGRFIPSPYKRECDTGASAQKCRPLVQLDRYTKRLLQYLYTAHLDAGMSAEQIRSSLK